VTTSPCLRHDPYLRRTPVVQLDLAGPVTLKLEQLITGDRYADALEAAQQWIAAPGAMGVHACDQRETILGQATLALELDGQAGPLDMVLVPCRAGGLVFPITQAWVQDVALADDDAIRAAQHTLWHAARTAAESAAAVGVPASKEECLCPPQLA
jgi:threonine dehydratase